MARHDQKPKAERMLVCIPCKADNCNECIDVRRVLASLAEMCSCTRRGHAGEPRDKQVLDPETGVVHAPGLTVSPEGEVTRNG